MTLSNLLLREFNKYTELVTVEKEVPTEDDIDFFLEKFLSRATSFFYENNYSTAILCANSEDPLTGEKPYDMSNKTYKEAHAELKPLLMEKAREAYGSVSPEANRFHWETAPKTVADYERDILYDSNMKKETWESMSETEKSVHPIRAEAGKRALAIKSRIREYNQKVLPFMLRKTMHHPIAIVKHSTTTGYIPLSRLGGDEQYIKINSEEELQTFMSKKTYDPESGFPGGKHDGIRSLLWTPSESGRNVKMGIIDIDNPAKLPQRDLRMMTRQVANILESYHHPYIIMFTGKNFQIWFGATPDNPQLGDMRVVSEMIRVYLHELGSFSYQEAIDNETFHFDESVSKKRRDGKSYQPTRMFFSLHYPISQASDKEYTGLAAVPVPIDDLVGSNPFEPAIHAHPEYVYDNFDMYASLVSAFFDEVQIGQDYEGSGETESTPLCNRSEDKHREHELVSLIDDKNNSIPVVLEDIAKKVADEKAAYVYAKTRGVDAVLKYNAKGGLRFGKSALKSEVTILDRMGKQKTRVEETRAALITRTGIVIWDDWISRELERHCQFNDIGELTLVGQLVSYDYMGNELEESEILGVLARGEEIDPWDMKSLKFVVHKIASHNHDEVPIDAMIDAITSMTTNRLMPGPARFFKEPMGIKIKKYYKNIREQRRGNQLVVLGEEKYFISSTSVISMAILGVDKGSRLFQQESPEIGPVFVGLMKTTSSKGPVYHIVAKAEIALKRDDRIKLKEMVFGENNTHRVPIGVRDDKFTDVIEVVEPKVVVDVVYDSVSRRMHDSAPFTYLPGTFEGVNRAEIYRMVEQPSYATRIEGAKIIKIREDLDPRREAHITHKQDRLIEISGITPKSGLSIVKALPNPVRTEDMYFSEDKPFGEEIDVKVPWKMSEKAFKKLSRLTKGKQTIGYVYKKRIYYTDTKDWTILGENDAFIDASMTFRSITVPFNLRGIDIINATKMSAEYGIKWHLLVSKGVFYWIYCDIENSEIKSEQKKYLADEEYDGSIEDTLSDLLHTITTTYSPKEIVKDAKVPGFVFDITVVEKIKNNPAFHGVPPYMDHWMDVYVDYEQLDEPRLVTTDDGVFELYQLHGRKANNIPLIHTKTTKATKKIPAEFANSDEPGTFGRKHKVFIDENSLNMYDEIPHFSITGLPESYQVAKDDPWGYGADGNRIVKGGLEPYKYYYQQMDSHRLSNRRQAKEDAKLLSEMFDYIPGGKGDLSPDATQDPQTHRHSGISSDYVKAVDIDDQKIKKALKGKSSSPSILKNPPLKASAWATFVDKYEMAYAEWEQIPEPKEVWELNSVGLFPSHLVPMLEKERIFRKARSENELTEDELRIVNETFSAEMSGMKLESTLGDLFEEPEEDEEVEQYEPEDVDFDY